MVRHQERRARDGHDLVAAGALRVHPAARNPFQVGEPGVAVRTGSERCVHDGPPATLDEPEIEGYFPWENQAPVVTHPRDRRARQHAQGGHRDDLLPHPTHHDEGRVSHDFHVVELDAIRAADHDPVLGLAREVGGGRRVRRSVVRAWEPCAGVASESSPR